MSERESFFFSELKRRNVYKVAVAYVVVAWLRFKSRPRIPFSRSRIGGARGDFFSARLPSR